MTVDTRPAAESSKQGLTDFDVAEIFKRDAERRGEPWPPPQPAPFEPIRPKPTTATIYFLGPKDGPIKIGYASRINVRLRDLRLANAFPLHLWASVEAKPALEREYHARFAAHRLHGEWFARCPEIEAEIERLCGLSLCAGVGGVAA